MYVYVYIYVHIYAHKRLVRATTSVSIPSPRTCPSTRTTRASTSANLRVLR